jgi:hypothetical protein
MARCIQAIVIMSLIGSALVGEHRFRLRGFPEEGGRESGQLIRFLSENEYWVNAGRNIKYFRRVRGTLR